MKKHKRRFGDRYDGRLLKRVDPFYKIIPYIMKSRVDSQVYFDDKIIIDKTEKYLQQKREEFGDNISFLHIVIAAIVRTISQKPRLNRFVSGRKIYSRNQILISLAVKKDMTEDSPETTVKMEFEPTDTIFDVIEKVNKVIESNLNQANNDTDETAKLIMMCPSFIVRFLVKFLTFLDNHGKMPKFINKVSPFHTSLFITDLGSLGIQPVYHHIYEFGTTSIFIAFGIKNKEKVFDKNNNIIEHKYIDLKVVADERICDGFYYAKAFRIFKRYMENPRLLEKAPESVVEDNEI